ncbi:unnamed protein product, partial [Rotaria socialis]
MLIFMSYCPNLRRFKVYLDGPHNDLCPYIIILQNRHDLILNLQDEWSFEQLLTTCPYLKHLALKLEARKGIHNMLEPLA